MERSRRRLWGVVVVATVVALWTGAGVVAAHGGGLRGAVPERLAVPTWLFLLTGGGAVGASFLLVSFVTDRRFLGAIHRRRSELSISRGALRWVGRAVGLLGLGAVGWTGLFGPAEPLRNAAVLLVWVGWWAGLVAASYLLGNAWPAVDPSRTLVGLLRRIDRSLALGDRSLPARLGVWPATVGLLALVYLEVVSPLGRDPRLLGLAVLGYVAVTVAGVATFGADWYERADPVSRLFATYGRLAPVRRSGSGFALRLPGAGLTADPLDDPGEVAFVLALLWGTTFDGAIGTPAWASIAGATVGLGVPPAAVYLGGLLGGFVAFLAGFRLAVRVARRTAPTYRTTDALARRFAPSLVPIAAGYHLAHYLGYFLALSPALASALAAPFGPPANPPTLALPGWFGAAPPLLVLAGHLLAVWVAHAVAFGSFPGRLQAVRSQVPLAAAMVGYTTVSLWLISQPSVAPPYV